jgi:O-antigen/teichoic acid export membrane protein
MIIDEVLNKIYNIIKDNFNKKTFVNKFSRDVVWTLLSKVILAISGISLNIIIGNYYGSSGLGVFSQVVAIFTVIMILSDLGTSTSTIKFVSENRNDIERNNIILSSSLILSSFFSLFIICLLYLIYQNNNNFYFSKTASIGLIYISLAIPFYSINRNMLGFLNGLRDMRIYSIMLSLRWILIIIFVIILSIFSNKVITTFYSFVISEIIIFIIMTIIVFNKYKFRLFYSIAYIKKNFVFSYRILINSFIGETNNRTDIFIASLFLNESQLGLHSFAISVARGFLMIPSVVMINFNPIISELYSKKEYKKLNNYIKKIKTTLYKINIPIIILGVILYPLIVRFLMPMQFVKSIQLFYLIMPGISLMSIYIFAGSFLLMSGKLNKMLQSVFIIFSLGIISNYILIQNYQLIGAAIATSLFYIYMYLSIKYFINKYTHVKI